MVERHSGDQKEVLQCSVNDGSEEEEEGFVRTSALMYPDHNNRVAPRGVSFLQKEGPHSFMLLVRP